MVQIEFMYFEIIDRDFTGVEVRILDDGCVLAKYRNFSPTAAEMFGNQSERFSLPTVEMALDFVRSCPSYSPIHFEN